MNRTATAPQPRPSRRVVRIGPEDHGRRMPLRDFARAEPVPGYLYELANGVIEVSDVPDLTHGKVVRRLNQSVTLYESVHPDTIEYVGGGAEAKIEMWFHQSERHPDLSIYLTPAPAGIEQPWDRWVPDIVVEVVSASSAKRDYEEKPDEYLAAGVREYWIIDPRKKSATFRVRRADSWIDNHRGARGKWRTSLLPGFTLELAAIFGTKRK